MAGRLPASSSFSLLFFLAFFLLRTGAKLV